MPRLIITHNVADVDAWLSFKAERAEAITEIGGTNVADHVAVDGSKSVAVSADVDDVEGFLASLASPPAEMAEVMQRHGVEPPLVAYVAK
ncbi:hypothetical protein [Hoyosella subflava]|uniref:Uncharacterized protein n=1 Tax=Hoyosella subflava (strain DSM 45089 / JCM 17490 / NBRC 109087 / DQS3-9A1) TaxID=443218 RepID=F6ELQ8_HOYSD|nr:hypothetical protein [Hoyosella subflava]AEF41506.1 hypothetical protein AS9A_3061 [Hoyosella subflava DQS3-9A1]